MSDRYLIFQGDCLEELKQLPDNSIDSMVTDPPAGISFFGKDWDGNKGGSKQWISWLSKVMTECLRVLKPGSHAFVWAIPRTSHWTATALEEAGFEIRDIITHLFGSGFPKSLNIGKQSGIKEYEGLGTSLKPASEHWILVRKPCSEKTIAANVIKHGTGGLNIEESRIGDEIRINQPAGSYLHTDAINDGRSSEIIKSYNEKQKTINPTIAKGRFPANLVLSHLEDCKDQCVPGCVVAKLEEQNNGASDFFYCAKTSTKERNEGCGNNTHPTVKPIKLMEYLINMITPPRGTVLDPFLGSGSTGVAAITLNFQFIGIEKEAEYVTIAEKRLEHASRKTDNNQNNR